MERLLKGEVVLCERMERLFKGRSGTLPENDTMDTEESGISSRYDASSSRSEGSEEGEYVLEMNPTLKRWL